jgi:hypothetical protein
MINTSRLDRDSLKTTEEQKFTGCTNITLRTENLCQLMECISRYEIGIHGDSFQDSMDTSVCEYSNPICEMLQYLNTTYAYPPIDSKSSIHYL